MSTVQSKSNHFSSNLTPTPESAIPPEQTQIHIMSSSKTPPSSSSQGRNGVKFATPLPQSSRSEILEWTFPKPFSQYTLTGRSRAAWHTSFVIPQLDLLLDAGLCVNKLRPKHIFITHGHNDHAMLTPAFIKRADPPDIYCPVETASVLDEYLKANRMLNLGLSWSDIVAAGGKVQVAAEGEGSEDDDEDDKVEIEVEDDKTLEYGPSRTGKPAGASILATHNLHGLVPGAIVPLRRTKNIDALAFKCDHTLPCLGFVFRQTTHKLKPEYTSLSGPEIKALRESGTVEITRPVVKPIFAFLGDTTASVLASEPEWLREGIPVVITECSFLREEHRKQAVKTKHTIWADLEPIVRKWPRTTFVVTHFSLRYSEEEIRRFFNGLEDPPANLVVWIDGIGE